MTSVVSIRNGEPYDVYVGRAGNGEDGYYGNPYPKGQVCSRCGVLHATAASTLPCFEAYFLARIRDDAEYRSRIRGLKGKVLGCFCILGNPCHAKFIAQWLDRPDDVIDREIDDAMVAARGNGAHGGLPRAHSPSS